jgi:hypothetical protein
MADLECFWRKTPLSPLGVNRDGSTFGVILLICRNGWYDNMKMGKLFHSLVATPTIPTNKIVDLVAP